MDLDRDNPLAVEIQQEMAGAYLDACRKMVESLQALKAFDYHQPIASLNEEQKIRRTELLTETAERVFFVVIQREAMKLSGYEHFFAAYEVPPEVRKCMGPRRPK